MVLLGKKCPWISKSAHENFQKMMPVNHEKCPWKRPKKCPWTKPLIREFSARSAREPKKMPVKIVRKMRFTGTFEVHAIKHCVYYIVLYCFINIRKKYRHTHIKYIILNCFVYIHMVLYCVLYVNSKKKCILVYTKILLHCIVHYIQCNKMQIVL